MRKKNIIRSVLLAASVLVTGLGISPIFAFASSQDVIVPYTIGDARAYYVGNVYRRVPYLTGLFINNFKY